MTIIFQDFRFALRMLVKYRSFTAVAVLTLAFALGANTAIFTVVNAILLQPLPFPDPQRVVAVTSHNTVGGGGGAELSYPNIVDIDQQMRTLSGAAGYIYGPTFLMEGPEPERHTAASVSSNLFRVLGVTPLLGRTFTVAEDRHGGASVMILSHAIWQRRFGSDPHIVGRSIRVGSAGKSRTVVGVMPAGFKFPIEEDVDFWMPLVPGIGADNVKERGAVFIDVVGRIRPDVTLAQARAEAELLSRRLEGQYPQSNLGLHFDLDSLQDKVVRPVRPALLMLLGAVAVVLLIGCANVANLLLARAAARHKEISIRSAIGASRGRIIRQLLVESVVLAVLAGALGLLLATWGVAALVSLAPPEVPRLEMVQVDGLVLAFTLALSVLTGLVFGLAPALSASRTDLTESLKEGTRGSTEGRRRNRTRNVLVTAEIALSVILLVAAGLLLRSFVRLSRIDTGFDYHNAIVLDISARAAAYKTDPEIVAFYDRVRNELRTIPGINVVGAANHLPLGGNENVFSFSIAGRPPLPVGRRPVVTTVSCSPDYFRAMAIPLLRGRDLNEHDKPGSAPVVVVSALFAKRYFGNESPIGHRLLIANSDQQAVEIVGVVGDVRFLDLASDPRPTVYLAESQFTSARFQFVVRAANASGLERSLRAALHKVDPRQPVLAVRTLERMHGEALAGRRFTLVLIGMLAILALVLAAVGIYSIMSYTVTQRTAEIGIRMALGAEARDVVRLILGQSLRLVGVGILVGVAVALAATRLLSTLLFGVTTTDPSTFVAICAVIATVALTASFIPANRAARVDPQVAIRYD